MFARAHEIPARLALGNVRMLRHWKQSYINAFAVAFCSFLSLEFSIALGAEQQHEVAVQNRQPPIAAREEKKTWIRVNERRSEFWVFSHPGESLSGKLGATSAGTISGTTGAV